MNAKQSFMKYTGLVLLGVTMLFAAQVRAAENPLKPGPHVIKAEKLLDRSVTSVNDRGVGLLDKGQLSDLITNFGILADFHFGTPSLHWPRNGTDVQHYGFGVSLLMVVDGSVLSSIYDPSSASTDFTWEAADGSLGRYFNNVRDEENTAADEITPLLASSDRPSTWPVVNGKATWPGPFRVDLTDPTQQVQGEFTSDRDIYAVITDKLNKHIRVEQIGYSYGRPYAEDFLFLRFRVHNDGTSNYSDVYAGFQADLKPDFYADDRIGAWAVNPYDTGTPSFFFKQDLNGIAQRDDSSHFGENWIGPVGMIGIGLLDSPGGAGVTSFHYYNDDNSPVNDQQIKALMTNNPAGLEHPEWYFHGTDSTFADLSLQAEIDTDPFPGSEPTFTIATGPFNLAAGDSAEFSIVIAIGADSTELAENVATAYQMAKTSYYEGSGPPSPPPLLRATAGDGYVQLTWNDAAERSVDAITGLQDFEGYRLYKSTDQGVSWGEEITNWFGEPVGYKPIFQCDVIDSVTGLDPTYGPDYPSAHVWLGDDTGLRHSYVDTDVTNGLEVWYTITSYDKGTFDPNDPLSAEPSYESPFGQSPADRNTVAAVPGTQASDIQPGLVGTISEINGLMADGTINMEVIDPSALTGDDYQLTFNEVGDSVTVDGVKVEVTETTANLEDLTTGSFTYKDMLNGETFEYINIPLRGSGMPVVDGFRLEVEDVDGAGVRTLGWTTVMGDSSTFDWWTEDRSPSNPSSYPEVVYGGDDWRITVTSDSALVALTAIDWSVGIVDSIKVPVRVERSPNAETGVWDDVTNHLWISDLRIIFDNDAIMGPLGWDLTPGGAGYNPTGMGDVWPDMLVLRDDEDDTTGSILYLKTQNGPASAIPPSVGDVYTIITYKNFTSQHIYEFTTEASQQLQAYSLDDIRVVPNPYIVRSGLELDENDARVMFTHLPAQCTIDIYTVAGRKVITLDHRGTDGAGYAYWDMRNREGQDVAYGVYVYVVKAGDMTHTGKLMVIR